MFAQKAANLLKMHSSPRSFNPLNHQAKLVAQLSYLGK
jgi:hypothetical protein